jgi:CheY-like chemotaxis protein
MNTPVSLALWNAHRELVRLQRPQRSMSQLLLRRMPSLSILLLRRQPLPIEASLLDWGHQLCVRPSMSTALATLQDHGPRDLVLADWKSSHPFAGRFYRLARRLQHPESLHCVAMTDGQDGEEGQRALEDGADSVLDNGCLPLTLSAT